jgi:catechol 2,3-dioxygenase-like lactoylglutathione lyase family enzyme
MDNPSIMSHISIGTNAIEKASLFYDAVMATIGAKRIMEYPGAIAYGKEFPEFWLQVPHDGGRAETANGIHFGFIAPSKDAVHAFYMAALENGAKGDGEPGPRPLYGEPYYGCFVRDLDGHKIEAAYWDMELAAKSASQTD